MYKPYTCHQCGTEFDLLPEWAEGRRMQGRSEPSKVKINCPGCYNAGYTGCPGSLNPPGLGNMVYTIDLNTMQPI